jgi:NitT/TauT family transport system ATP-binding protein
MTQESKTSPVIVATAITKRYVTAKGTIEALQATDLQIREGEFVSLVGPSGCGKSTVLHIIAGLIEPSGGTLQVAGQPARAGRPDTAIMLQKPVLLPWRTVERNVLLRAELLGMDKSAARQRTAELLDLVGLAKFAGKYPWELSGGMRQRAGLAQTLVSNPAIVLMDEPFSAVDEFTRERLNVEVAALHDRLHRTSVFVTHNIHEAAFLSDRIVVMRAHPGSIITVIQSALPRPRTPESFADPRMQKTVSEIRDALTLGQEIKA